MNNIAIIIQGSSTNVTDQKKAWEGYLGNCIFSTWVGEEYYYEEVDTVLFNEKPQDPGPMNFNYQMESTLAGLRYAQEKGYGRALKIRSDLVPTNAEVFLKLIDNSHFNFLCWHHHRVYPNCPGYLIDYLMSGNTQAMIDLWTIDSVFCTVPEVILTWNYITKYSDTEVNYFLEELDTTNTLHWIKRDISLHSYKKNDVYDKYDKYSFSQDHSNLHTNYLQFLK